MSNHRVHERNEYDAGRAKVRISFTLEAGAAGVGEIFDHTSDTIRLQYAVGAESNTSFAKSDVRKYAVAVAAAAAVPNAHILTTN